MINKLVLSKIKNTMSPYRFQHTTGVVNTAGKLAGLYGADPQKAEIAALFHDIAREYDAETLVNLSRHYGIEPDEIEHSVPDLLHGKVGAAIAEEKYGIKDPVILEAIKWHTTGKKNMSIMDKIVFVADMIEPGRQFPGVEILREKAAVNLNESVIAGLNSTIRFVLERGFLIHPHSIEARNHLLMLR